MQELRDPRGAAWWPAPGISLHEHQLRAIYQEGNFVLDAGAGTGKTEVLTHLVMHRLQTGAIAKPKRILMLSYKKDSGRVFRERVSARIPDEVRRVDVLTLDAFAKGLVDRFRLALPEPWRLDPYRLVFDLPEGLRFDGSEETRIAWSKLMRGPTARATLPMLSRLATIILNSSPGLKGQLQSTFGLLLVDEVQDTTEAQFELLTAAFSGGPNQVIAVGDGNQRIMEFAGALPDALTSFQSTFGGSRLNFQINYRSAERLVQMQSRALGGLGLADSVKQEASPGRGAGTIRVLENQTEHDEAGDIARMVQAWILKGHAPREICILVRDRSRVETRPIIAALAKKSIRSRDDERLQDLNAELVVQCILDALELTGARNTTAWNRLHSVLTDLHGRSFGANETGPGHQLAHLQQGLRRLLPAKPSAEWVRMAVAKVLECLGGARLGAIYPPYLDANYLEATITKFSQEFETSLKRHGNLADAIVDFRGDHLLPLLTIHKSKGLQFRSVVVVGIEDGHYADKKSGQFSRDERSNLFVAISRAVENLVLTRVWRRRGMEQTWDEVAPVYSAIAE